MEFFQNLIHRLEVGGGMRYLRIGLSLLAVLFLAVGYNWRAFRNMGTQEAMDSAQLARNIAEGNGYTTLFVRPLSMYLVKRKSEAGHPALDLDKPGDPCRIKDRHPDLANPPVYPVMLAGLMKVLPFNYAVDTTHPFWSSSPGRGSASRQFYRYEPDFLISAFNQALFFGLIAVVFFWARRVFDPGVAWLSALLLLGTELYWRFSISCLSTMLLLLIFMGLVWCLTLLEEETREPKWGPQALLVLAGIAGALVGFGALTRYAFAWLIVPVVVFVVVLTGRQRVLGGVCALLAFVLVLGPWVLRNYSVSGTPFGTATYAALETTFVFPENKLQRSLEPDLGQVGTVAIWHKLMQNTRQIAQSDLPRLGGSWVSALFLAGLLMSFRSPAVRRMRYFLLGCLLLLCFVQALGRTQLSEESPDINSENLLVLVAPLVLVYGVSLFLVLLEQIELPFRELRYVALGGFGVIVSLPLLLIFLPPKSVPVAFPPYLPPTIQTLAGWTKDSELTMSDVPWAMAWYGHRQCAWLTLNPQSDFFAINDYQKPVSLIYFTPLTLNSGFGNNWFRLPTEDQTWASLLLASIAQNEIPRGFPLRRTFPNWLPHQLFLTDWERWRKVP
jgi:hypothetical protein